MIFNSIVFSLAAPQDNLYIQMFVLCYFSFLKHKVFNPQTDQYYLTCDQESADFIKKTYSLVRHVKFLVVPKPKSVYDGMTLKYVLPFVVNLPDEPILYTDTDIFCMRPFRIECQKDSLVCYPEGSPTDSNYCGDMTLNNPAGYTAGFFVYRWGDKVKTLFSRIIHSLQETPKKYYTLDQPYFNKYAEDVPVKMMDQKLMSLNGNTSLQTAVVMNCCGEPGDGNFHWSKMLQLYLVTTA